MENIGKVRTEVCANSHMGEGSMNGSAADFHSGDGVQDFDSTLERLKIWVLIRKNPESPLADAKANARVNILFCGFEPSIARSLSD